MTPWLWLHAASHAPAAIAGLYALGLAGLRREPLRWALCAVAVAVAVSVLFSVGYHIDRDCCRDHKRSLWFDRCGMVGVLLAGSIAVVFATTRSALPVPAVTATLLGLLLAAVFFCEAYVRDHAGDFEGYQFWHAGWHVALGLAGLGLLAGVAHATPENDVINK